MLARWKLLGFFLSWRGLNGESSGRCRFCQIKLSLHFAFALRPKELLCDSVAQNLWIDLCRAQKDLLGLKASQIALAQFFDHSADGVALEGRFR